jgi:hypothetical protein
VNRGKSEGPHVAILIAYLILFCWSWSIGQSLEGRDVSFLWFTELAWLRSKLRIRDGLSKIGAAPVRKRSSHFPNVFLSRRRHGREKLVR